jgi:hypothetical protein
MATSRSRRNRSRAKRKRSFQAPEERKHFRVGLRIQGISVTIQARRAVIENVRCVERVWASFGLPDMSLEKTENRATLTGGIETGRLPGVERAAIGAIAEIYT